MNRLSLAFFAVAILIVAFAVTALAARAVEVRYTPVPAADESVADTAGPPGPATRS